jgi:hypothetical protein
LPKVDQIAEVVHAGSVEDKKQLIKTLFERIEQRDGELTRLDPRAWAKPFFNGGDGAARNGTSGTTGEVVPLKHLGGGP